jgi:hypothetical protein
LIITMHFAADTDELLQKLQHGLYPAHVRALYEWAAERHTPAPGAPAPGDEAQLQRRLHDADRLDLQALEEVHDRIAAWFRFTHPHARQTTLFPPADPATGRPLTHGEMLRRDWQAFFRQECRALLVTENMPRAVLEAVAFRYEKRGLNAEEALLWSLDRRYARLARARERWESRARR